MKLAILLVIFALVGIGYGYPVEEEETDVEQLLNAQLQDAIANQMEPEANAARRRGRSRGRGSSRAKKLYKLGKCAAKHGQALANEEELEPDSEAAKIAGFFSGWSGHVKSWTSNAKKLFKIADCYHEQLAAEQDDVPDGDEMAEMENWLKYAGHAYRLYNTYGRRR